MALAARRGRECAGIVESPWFRGVLVSVLALALQLSVVADLRIGDAAADLMLGLAIAAGLVAGRDRGVVAAFCLGLLYDLVLNTPFGLSALAYTLTAFVVTRLSDRMLHPVWWFAMAVGVGASAIGVGIYATVGSLFGLTDVFTLQLLTIVAVVAIVNGLAMPALLRVQRRVLGGAR